MINRALAVFMQLGQWGLAWVEKLGHAALFLAYLLWHTPRFKKWLSLTIEQVYSVGVLSLLISVLAGVFIGMVIGLEGYNTLAKFGASQQLGQLLALSIVRELGPVITALLFAGRAGSALTAEIGLMKISEQLTSMAMMGIDPIRRIITPRFWAGVIANPLLTMIFNTVAILGGYLVGVEWLGVDHGIFLSTMQANVDFQTDISYGLIKSVLFGWIISWIAVFQGYDTVATAEGMGRATTRTVVYSAVVVLGLDFLLTALMIGGQ